MATQGRKYPRVFLTKNLQEFDKIIGIEAHLENGVKLGVLDISYIGAALLKSSQDSTQYAKGDKLNLAFNFTGQSKPHSLIAQVVRMDERVLAVHFPEMEVGPRLALQKFLKEKLIGLNMHLVSSEFYMKEQKFDFWFHGPNETNVFVWGTKNNVQKVTVEINREVLTWENGILFLSKTKDYLAAPTEDYAYQVNFPDDKKQINQKDPLFHSVVSLLSQIGDETGIIDAVSKKILSKA